MMVELSWPLIGLIGAIVIHAASTIWWASKINANVTFMRENLSQIRDELERRDVQIGAIWKRIDELRDMIHAK